MSFFRIGVIVFLALCACDPPSTEECNERTSDIADAINAAPADWLTCAVDDDCSKAADTPKHCGYFCGGVPVAEDHAADLENFLRSDATLASKCKAYRTAGCEETVPIPHCPAEIVRCVSGTCQLTLPFEP
jgi:hypothetical protein